MEDADGEELDRCIGEPFGTEKKTKHVEKGIFAFYTVISHLIFPSKGKTKWHFKHYILYIHTRKVLFLKTEILKIAFWYNYNSFNMN